VKGFCEQVVFAFEKCLAAHGSSSVAEFSLFSLVFVRLCRGLGFVRKGKEKGGEGGCSLKLARSRSY